MDQLEAHVWQSVCTLLQDPERVMQEWSRRADTRRTCSEDDAQRADELRLVRSHERTLQRLVDAYEAGAIDLAELTTRSERVRARMARARDELAALERVLAEKRELQVVVAHVKDFAQRLRTGLDTLSWEERQAVARTIIARIEIDDDDVTVVYRVPGVGSTTAPTAMGSAAPEFVDCVQGVRTPAYRTVWKRGGGTLVASRQRRESGSRSTATVEVSSIVSASRRWGCSRPTGPAANGAVGGALPPRSAPAAAAAVG